jgi:hypothetical protein
VSGRLRVALAGGPLERLAVDVAVVGVLSDERPLQGCAGRADWRLCGRLSALLDQGRLRGEVGEAALLPSTGGIRAPLVLALGHGQHEGLDGARCRAIARDAVARALDLRAATLALPVVESVSGAPALEVRLGELLAGAFEAWAQDRPELALEIVAAAEEAPAVAEFLRAARDLPEGVEVVLPQGPERGPRRPPRGIEVAAPIDSPPVK